MDEKTKTHYAEEPSPEYLERVARIKRFKKAYENSGKTQMVCAVEMNIGLSTFCNFLKGNPVFPKNPVKRATVEVWIKKQLGEYVDSPEQAKGAK